ncbi:acyl--CoA ligase [Mycobacterium sp. Y57]|uniref:class I adenylate-forming enzyme family protein n=1 Tax=Mycolicibacterium xanthum TaxID=2796469 RepID=UPI001C866896|nr:class I adenylate-forming enzyme family protein [Mycolicibacterium xanthum]MBX7430510.1 acyl--CoA ligase [Mycolicibacterium xanthum]
MTSLNVHGTDRLDEARSWGASVVRATVRGRPTLVYEHRPHSVGAIVGAGRRWRDREFVVQGPRRVTFAQHEAAVRRAAAALHQRGVAEGDRVAIFAANSPEWSVAFLAALELGAIVVPCNGWWSADEAAHACALTSPALVVADTRRAGRLPAGSPIMLVDELRGATERASEKPDVAVPVIGEDEDRTAVILFTSGTTGFPKGATLSHRSLVANLQNLIVASNRLPYQLSDDHRASVTLTGLPLFHIGAINLLLLPFVSGAKLVFPSGRFDAAEVLRLIEVERVNTWSGVPTMIERVLAHPDLATRDVTSVRTVVLGGAPISTNLLERISAAFPNATRGVGQSYGTSEAGGVLSTGVSKDLVAHPGSSGRIVPVAEIRIDAPDEKGIGEIQARSPAVMDGYWGEPESTGFTDDGWLLTGDLGWVDDDGFLYVTGRSKDMIIRGGENIAPAHIEACLMEHPAVREAAVVGLPDPDLGEEVGAVVSVDPGSTDAQGDLEAFLAARLAHFEVPARWWLREDELPKNDSGKILKYRLREEWISRLPVRGPG